MEVQMIREGIAEAEKTIANFEGRGKPVSPFIRGKPALLRKQLLLAENTLRLMKSNAANPILQAYSESVQPPVAPENVATVPPPVSVRAPNPALRIGGPLPGSSVVSAPRATVPGLGEAAGAQVGRTLKRRNILPSDRSLGGPINVLAPPVVPSRVAAKPEGPVVSDASLKSWVANPMLKESTDRKKRLAAIGDTVSASEYRAIPEDLKKFFVPKPGPSIFGKAATYTKKAVGGRRLRKRTLKKRRGVNKRNGRGSRRS